ncbi:sensor histidine kinase [Paenibacillus thalictri]|uniref:Sensor histidine kinase n=1 Tax=Paenibacillus thalictri TaxID=2527873 RepID=A0A4Q9DIW0_9BACL|nr:histidine kinase [Paenibacillus thalictri]TBL73314.1 sensor histidine kinase [Paenibacillus thalictri]
MISFEGFTLLILLFILAPIVGAIILLFLFIFEKRIDLLENKAKKIELEKELQQALYSQLNQQIQPHFLFNSLNVILTLARLKRNEELVRALEVFSQFLKFKYKTDEPMIPLREEIRYTEYYIEIQKLRFGARLSIAMECEERLKQAFIPPFVLQTIVENAFKHGLERKVGDVSLNVRFYHKDENAYLTVLDNGPPDSPADEPPEPGGTTEQLEKSGYGLDNIRRRLHLCFADQADLTMRFIQGSGTEVHVKWPFITKPAAEEVPR